MSIKKRILIPPDELFEKSKTDYSSVVTNPSTGISIDTDTDSVITTKKEIQTKKTEDTKNSTLSRKEEIRRLQEKKAAIELEREKKRALVRKRLEEKHKEKTQEAQAVKIHSTNEEPQIITTPLSVKDTPIKKDTPTKKIDTSNNLLDSSPDLDLEEKVFIVSPSNPEQMQNNLFILGLILLIVILLWGISGILMSFDIIPFSDFGYTWFNNTIYPLF